MRSGRVFPFEKSEDGLVTYLDLKQAYRIEAAPDGQGTVIMYLGAAPVGVIQGLAEVVRLRNLSIAFLVAFTTSCSAPAVPAPCICTAPLAAAHQKDLGLVLIPGP